MPIAGPWEAAGVTVGVPQGMVRARLKGPVRELGARRGHLLPAPPARCLVRPGVKVGDTRPDHIPALPANAIHCGLLLGFRGLPLWWMLPLDQSR